MLPYYKLKYRHSEGCCKYYGNKIAITAMGNIKASRAITPQIPTPFFKIASKENKSNN